MNEKKSFGPFKKNQPSTRKIIPLKTINKPLINHHFPVVIPLIIIFLSHCKEIVPPIVPLYPIN